MRFAFSRFAAVAIVALTTVACTDTQRSVAPEAAPLLALTGRDSATFVLTRVENQTAEPIVTVDLTCAGVRYQHTLRDTITVWTDGRARVATALTDLHDGVAANSSYLVATGQWVRNTRTDAYYYSAAPSLVLTVQYPRLTAEIWLRQAWDAAVTRLAPMGGSCGTGSNAREAEFTYIRR